MFFLATADAEGRPQCSYKGGDPGFVRGARRAHHRVPQLRRQRHVPLDRQPAREPERGAAVHRLLRQAAPAPAPQRGRRASSRTTRCSPASPAPSSWCASARVQVFPNCPRYIHRMQLVERSPFVPRAGRGDAGAGLEARRLGPRRPAGGRPGARLTAAGSLPRHVAAPRPLDPRGADRRLRRGRASQRRRRAGADRDPVAGAGTATADASGSAPFIGSLAADPKDGTLIIGTGLGLFRLKSGAQQAEPIEGELVTPERHGRHLTQPGPPLHRTAHARGVGTPGG